MLNLFKFKKPITSFWNNPKPW